MKPLFADTAYFIALLSDTDEKHDLAIQWSDSTLGQVVTTEYVFIELGNGLARSKVRPHVAPYIRKVLQDPATRFVPTSTRLFGLGLELYANRLDKTWSLVDCISFVVMNELRITDALTTDHHFEQAGFRALLRV